MSDRAFHSYEPSNGHGLRNDPFNSIVAPRPIGWVSSLSADGVANLAPYSFFNIFSYRPPLLGFASNGWKDSVRNICETGEFVWNLTTRDLAGRMNVSSAEFPPDVDEFEAAGLARLPSTIVAPARVAEAPVSMECRLTQLVRLTGADGAQSNTWMVLGEIVMIHIDEACLIDGHYDTVAARPILRGGGTADYFEIDAAARFKMKRPAEPAA